MTKSYIIGLDWNSTLADNISMISKCTGIPIGRFDTWNPDIWTPELGYRLKMNREQLDTWMWTEPMLQALAESYPGAAEGVSRLSKYRHPLTGQAASVWIVTSTSCPGLVQPWLRRWGIPFDRVVVTGDKASVEWDVLLDDRPDTLLAMAASGRQVLRHSIGWNRHLTGIRGFNWG